MQIEDPGELRFRQRRQRRGSRPTSPGWWLLAAIAAVLFVLVIRALLDRTAWTAGRSVPSAPGAVPGIAQMDEAGDAMPPNQDVPMVYRCVDREGGVSLQSRPCGPGQRTTRAIPAPPDIEPLRAPAPAPSRPSSRRAYRVDVPPMPNYKRQQRLAVCAGAKAQRESVLEAVGLRRTYDLLQRLDEAVREACKGV